MKKIYNVQDIERSDLCCGVLQYSCHPCWCGRRPKHSFKYKIAIK